MLQKILTALCFVAMIGSASAQNATSLQGMPIVTPPASYPPTTYQPCPNCAPLDGLGPVFNSALGGYVLDVPHVSGGWSSFNTIISLVNNQWNWLDTPADGCSTPPLPGPYCFFRGGLAAYPNGGFWNLTDGVLTVAGPSGTIYYVNVYVGTNVEPHTGYWLQPDMINGGADQTHYQRVGGGSRQCDGPDNSMCQINFSGHLIFCGANGPTGIGPQACEIRVAVYPATSRPTAITALMGSIPPYGPTGQGGVQAGFATYFYLSQERGLY